MNRRGLLAMLLGLACVWGCSDSSPKVPGRSLTVKASGTVTMNGKPVDGATVMFNSEQLNLTAYGKTDTNGYFELTTYESEDGAPVGHYRVVIKKVEQAVTGESQNPALPPMTESSLCLPAKYSQWETSGLKAVVVEGADNAFSFDLLESPEAL
ncbi:carboxypeptidase-like regulatory domain-containing protein [Blastopirellula marina]|uniref:Carboxypeptidase regulatory-like domain-containing protein n=1 Tax=Blastopirellula marina TaxID=124 RepID=A0A2S8F6F0_9BACT|nr:carboxypeptidase-like regulatory domain-containing protein [Blastopirellula marina]PQO27737.1 hypothetical protein C5Y98_26945 [Blastopirellula marina]PTL41476.1 carboxypeptidase regulatory-like domain-containing protein [Blastopirellula marina]